MAFIFINWWVSDDLIWVSSNTYWHAWSLPVFSSLIVGDKSNHVPVNWVIIPSCNGSVYAWHQAIIWTYHDLLSMRPSWTNFSEIWIKIQYFSFIKMYLKMPSAKLRPFCFSLPVFNRSPRHASLLHIPACWWQVPSNRSSDMSHQK